MTLTMTLTLALNVPEAAARLGRSERTVWRQIRAGLLRTKREGRRVLVLVEADEGWPGGASGRRVREVAAPYLADREWQVGAWPYTPEIVERHRQARLARRRAAIETMKVLSRQTRPDPDDLTFQDYLDAERQHPRALEGGDAADLALEELARERRDHR
jgi:hypothetical protein